MGQPVIFPGFNLVLKPPRGEDELSCQSMPTFTNGVHSVSCWELDADELAEIARTGRIFVSLWSGRSQPPVHVGSENNVRGLIADVGTWKKDEPR